MEKVAIYLRVSTKEQAEDDKFGLPIQKEDCKNFCKNKDYEIFNIYTDEGVSGSLQNRKAMNQLFEDAKSGHFSKMIISKYDRLARDLYLQMWFEKELLIYNIEILSVHEDFAGQDPMKVMMRQMMGMFAQFEKSRISDRLLSGRIHKRGRGGFIGGQEPLGYFSIKGSKKLYINEEKVETVRRAFELRGIGSLTKIAATLNMEGHTTRDNKAFSAMQVKRIYDREALYLGEYEAPPILV
ncbi:recombinase family protein [Anaerobacillus isosaccharinicus]|uniref:Recombinase family protein n=1 Tax=Anaerobacillus isosaccharinicus TaxID=1532552 RepID=A0A1S2M6W9_9BACI|nr:recombinase family protein [Anaerobacillus isosaccharinicus]MBA5587086.1 recombinase family protein [Anaerobacillus isosaccharinicus]QOY34718.1 recombinase family protein [Anaerobacillus isosaccharinicus]